MMRTTQPRFIILKNSKPFGRVLKFTPKIDSKKKLYLIQNSPLFGNHVKEELYLEMQ